MQFSQILGKQLKDDSIMELLEHYDIEVKYDFDKTHEGMEDVYWAASQENGFQFRFDETQQLDVVFLYIEPHEGFTPLSHSEIDVPIYDTFATARDAFKKEGLEFVNSPSEDPTDNWYQRWIKATRGSCITHYEFKDKKLRMITLSLVK